MSVSLSAANAWSLSELIHCGLLRIWEEERIGNKLGKVRQTLGCILSITHKPANLGWRKRNSQQSNKGGSTLTFCEPIA